MTEYIVSSVGVIVIDDILPTVAVTEYPAEVVQTALLSLVSTVKEINCEGLTEIGLVICEISNSIVLVPSR